MIAVDTNVLLRRVLNDDEEQSEKARKLFDGARPVLITDVVLVESIWTLLEVIAGATCEKAGSQEANRVDPRQSG